VIALEEDRQAKLLEQYANRLVAIAKAGFEVPQERVDDLLELGQRVLVNGVKA
jgi:hypothetical protein